MPSEYCGDIYDAQPSPNPVPVAAKRIAQDGAGIQPFAKLPKPLLDLLESCPFFPHGFDLDFTADGLLWPDREFPRVPVIRHSEIPRFMHPIRYFGSFDPSDDLTAVDGSCL